MDKIRKLNKEYLQELASDIMLELTVEEINDISSTEESLRIRFAKVTSIDTLGLEPLNYPFEQPHSYLRDDEQTYKNDQKDLLANAATIDGDFITIVKVVK